MVEEYKRLIEEERKLQEEEEIEEENNKRRPGFISKIKPCLVS